MNTLLLIFHVLLIAGLTLFFLRAGKEAMVAWCAVLVILSNLFVHKQITLMGLNVTCSDTLAVGYLLSSNLIQEFFGKQAVKKSIWISFYLSIGFVFLSLIHLAYEPNDFDKTHRHFLPLLQSSPRIVAASIFSFLVVQFLDLHFFSYLREKSKGKFLGVRLFSSAFFAHGLDTILFGFLGLYGIVGSLIDVLLFSFLIKIAVTFLTTPFLTLSKKIASYEPV